MHVTRDYKKGEPVTLFVGKVNLCHLATLPVFSVAFAQVGHDVDDTYRSHSAHADFSVPDKDKRKSPDPAYLYFDAEDIVRDSPWN